MADSEKTWNSVWITGASSGIGLELARLIADKADHVAISARSADQLEAAAADHAALSAYPLDVTDADAVKASVDRIAAEAGPIDLAVLGAGTWKLMDVEEFDLAGIRAGVEVNYMGVANAVAALLPGMLARGSGHIVIVASVAGYRGLPKAVAYGPTKAALINLAETLKAELAPHGIKVSVVNPGFVDTPMTRSNPFPMPGMISAEEAARALLSGLEKGRYEIVFPTGFVMGMKFLRLLPNALYFWVVRNFILKNAK